MKKWIWLSLFAVAQAGTSWALFTVVPRLGMQRFDNPGPVPVYEKCLAGLMSVFHWPVFTAYLYWGGVRWTYQHFSGSWVMLPVFAALVLNSLLWTAFLWALWDSIGYLRRTNS